jgi:hypothetical protein
MRTLRLSHNALADDAAIAVAAALPLSPGLTTLDLCGNRFGAEGCRALAVAAAKSPSLTALCVTSSSVTAENEGVVNAGVRLGALYRQVLALLGAVVPGRPRTRNLAEAFVWGDGDTALAHRVLGFMLE